MNERNRAHMYGEFNVDYTHVMHGVILGPKNIYFFKYKIGFDFSSVFKHYKEVTV